MASRPQFKRLLPILQTALAAVFGGWGLWQRTTILSNSPFKWTSTLRFHVWPWPFQFAVIQNVPAFIAGSLLLRPLDTFGRAIPEWVSLLPSLLLVPILWWLIGSWVDRRYKYGTKIGTFSDWPWAILSGLAIVSLLAALCSEYVFHSYTAFIPFGVVVWMISGITMLFYRNEVSKAL
jgi:hypothetical protein